MEPFILPSLSLSLFELGRSQSDALDQGVLSEETGGYLSSLMGGSPGRRKERLRDRDGVNRKKTVSWTPDGYNQGALPYPNSWAALLLSMVQVKTWSSCDLERNQRGLSGKKAESSGLDSTTVLCVVWDKSPFFLSPLLHSSSHK